ncbi:MAG: hypothetical protein IT356_00555 [Gemmatimonadaceae bacterium]|nr:hypothetical protein [Gemmatimonadaceae bacterium]
MRTSYLFALAAALPLLGIGAQAPDSITLSGLQWRSIGPVNMAGRITDVEGVPGTRTFYVAGAGGGVWKTVNAGTTFFSVWDTQPIASIGDIAIAPSNPNVVYVGTGEGNSRNSVAPGWGVYRSGDGGVSWTSLGLEKTQHIGRIVVHPKDPNTVYVAALGAVWADSPDRGLYKSVNGGKTWQMSKFVSNRAGFTDVAMSPANPDVLFAASYEVQRKPAFLASGGPGSALWKTTDAGKTWTEVKGGGFPATTKGRMNIQFAPSNPNIVYVMVEADSVRGAKPQQLLSGLYRSADGGRTWKWMSTINNRPFYFSQIRVDPKNPNRIYRGAVDFAFSDDGGYSWTLSMVGNHEDYHGIWIDPTDPSHFIIGGDAGVFQTWDRGGTYDSMNNMPMGQFYGISYDYQVPYRVCGGLQDNGSSCGISRRRNGQLQMTDWFALMAADGLQTAQDPVEPNIVYYESQGGNMQRRDLATGLTANVKARTAATPGGIGTDPNAAARWNWNTPFIVSVHDHNVFYSGADKLFKSVEHGDNPRAISGDLTRADPTWLRVSSGFDAQGNPAADASGGITRDATGAEENSTIVNINESTIRAGLLYVGTDDGKVWLTRNDGAAWEDLSDHFSGVPPMAYVSKIDASHHDSATVYVARDNHRENDFKPYVFVSNDFGKTFRSISSNLPTDRPGTVYVVREDPVNPNLLYVGTETGVYASLNKGGSWFRISNNMPAVPVYDLQVHPRDHELIAGTHGRAIWILDVAPLQQMTPAVVAQGVYLFAPTTSYIAPITLPPSEPRSQRQWRTSGGPQGAEIAYKLGGKVPGGVKIMIVDARGDTIARINGDSTPGLRYATWNYQVSTPEQMAQAAQFGGGRGGFGGGFGGRGGRGGFSDTTQVAGFPRGFNPRPAEAMGAPDTTGSPTAVKRALEAAEQGGGRGGRGGRGGAGGGGRGFAQPQIAPTGDYRVVLDAGGVKQTAVLRVVKLEGWETSVGFRQK